MVRVTINGHLLADSDETKVIEGNYYFPPTSVRMSLLGRSNTTSVCSWKGTAAYYDAVVDETRINDIAWYYPNVITERAKPIEGYIAFYKDKVDIEEDTEDT